MKIQQGEYEIESTEVRDDIGILRENVVITRTLEHGQKLRYPIHGIIKVRTTPVLDIYDQRNHYNEKDLEFMLGDFLLNK